MGAAFNVGGGVGRQGYFHIAFFVFGFDGVGSGRLDGDGSVAVFNVAFAVDLAEVNIFGVRGDAHRALGFSDAEIVGVEVQVAGQAGQFEVGDRGVEVDRAGDVFNMHVAEDFTALRDLALDFRDGDVVGVAVDREIAVDLVSGEIVLAAGEVNLHGAFCRA